MASERVVVQHQLPPLGRHLVKKVWSEVKVMDYHHWKSPSSPWSRMLIPHSILPNHTEGHRLNGGDVLSRKAGLRLGKDSTGVEASPNQDKLRRMNKYCRLQGLNRCPLAWELGTLPLDHLGFDSKLPLLKVRGKTVIYILHKYIFGHFGNQKNATD